MQIQFDINFSYVHTEGKLGGAADIELAYTWWAEATSEQDYQPE
jgi:hypothetical protein